MFAAVFEHLNDDKIVAIGKKTDGALVNEARIFFACSRYIKKSNAV